SAIFSNSVDGRPLVLTTLGLGTTLADVQAETNPAPGQTPTGVVFPVGFVALKIQGTQAGFSDLARLTVPPGVMINAFYVFGMEHAGDTDHFYRFQTTPNDPSQLGADIQLNSLLMHLMDGQRGDTDTTADGFITMLVAPAFDPAAATHFVLQTPIVAITNTP